MGRLDLNDVPTDENFRYLDPYKRAIQKFGEGGTADRLLRAHGLPIPEVSEVEGANVTVQFDCGHRNQIGRDEYGDGSAWCLACKEFQVYASAALLHPLSPRQRITLFWLSNGHSVETTAEHMGCSVETVKSQLRTVRLRMGLTNATRELLIATALRTGIIP